MDAITLIVFMLICNKMMKFIYACAVTNAIVTLLQITYSVPYALISIRIESLGLGQGVSPFNIMLTDCTLHMSVVSYKSSVVAGLSLGVLNLAIVIPQVCFVQPSFLALYFAATHLNVSACKRESILPLY